MRIFAVAATLAAITLWAQGEATAAGDADRGEKVFNKCKACHSLEPGQNKVGPSLHGIVGQKAGTVEGYTRYKGLTDADFTWDEELLNEYLEDPKEFVQTHTSNKRSGMAFKLKDEQDRADVIEYLKTIE